MSPAARSTSCQKTPLHGHGELGNSVNSMPPKTSEPITPSSQPWAGDSVPRGTRKLETTQLLELLPDVRVRMQIESGAGTRTLPERQKQLH